MRLRLIALLLTLTLALLAAPLPAEAQKAGKVYRIGYLVPGSPASGSVYRETFLLGLRDLGWTEGQNLTIDWRWAEGRNQRLPELASELVRLKPDVIVPIGTPATHGAMNATRTIPIVFNMVSDPVGSGFVASLARPAGNVTGLTNIGPELAGKRLELLKEIVPGVSRVAVLWHSTNPVIRRNFKQAEVAARRLGVTLQSLKVRDPSEIEPAFSAMTRARAEVLLELGGAVTFVRRQRVADLALKHRLPTMFWNPRYVEAGGLMSYAPNYPAMFRRSAHYVDKILKGASPADLPVERPTKFDLVINLKTAKALGLTIPDSVLFQADRVIR